MEETIFVNIQWFLFFFQARLLLRWSQIFFCNSYISNHWKVQPCLYLDEHIVIMLTPKSMYIYIHVRLIELQQLQIRRQFKYLRTSDLTGWIVWHFMVSLSWFLSCMVYQFHCALAKMLCEKTVCHASPMYLCSSMSRFCNPINKYLTH